MEARQAHLGLGRSGKAQETGTGSRRKNKASPGEEQKARHFRQVEQVVKVKKGAKNCWYFALSRVQGWEGVVEADAGELDRGESLRRWRIPEGS